MLQLPPKVCIELLPLHHCMAPLQVRTCLPHAQHLSSTASALFRVCLCYAKVDQPLQARRSATEVPWCQQHNSGLSLPHPRCIHGQNWCRQWEMPHMAADLQQSHRLQRHCSSDATTVAPYCS